MAGLRKVEGRGWALLATSLGFAVVQLDVSVVNVAIQPIGADLGGSVEPSRSGVASGTLNTARQTGSVLGVSAFGALTSVGLVPALRLAATISVALAGGCAVLALAVRAEAA